MNKVNLGKTTNWHPWIGCTKISPACKNCFIKKFDTVDTIALISPERDYGSVIIPCLWSDFFLEEADQWRPQVWQEIKNNSHLIYLIITKRIERVKDCLPEDWGRGYDNVVIACTVETQELVEQRIPYLLNIPSKHKWLSCCPLIEPLDLTGYLSSGLIEHVECCGETGPIDLIRPTYYEWVVDLSNQCKEFNVRFSFMKIGHKFIKDGEQLFERCSCYYSTIADSYNLDNAVPLKFILDNKEFIIK